MAIHLPETFEQHVAAVVARLRNTSDGVVTSSERDEALEALDALRACLRRLPVDVGAPLAAIERAVRRVKVHRGAWRPPTRSGADYAELESLCRMYERTRADVVRAVVSLARQWPDEERVAVFGGAAEDLMHRHIADRMRYHGKHFWRRVVLGPWLSLIRDIERRFGKNLPRNVH